MVYLLFVQGLPMPVRLEASVNLAQQWLQHQHKKAGLLGKKVPLEFREPDGALIAAFAHDAVLGVIEGIDVQTKGA